MCIRDRIQGNVKFTPVGSGTTKEFGFTNLSGEYKTFDLSELTPGTDVYKRQKTAGAKVTDTDRKKSYRKSTIHQSEPKNKGLSRFKQNLKESNVRCNAS